MALALPVRPPSRTRPPSMSAFSTRVTRGGVLLAASLLWAAPAPAQTASSAEVQEVREMLETFIMNQRHTIDVL